MSLARFFIMFLLLGASIFTAPRTASASSSGSWWLEGRSACPGNAKLKGRAPPTGTEVGCVRPSGVWHGRRTQWFGKCTRRTPCDQAVQRKLDGNYRRGLEHGHWIWWHEDGSVGLEGQYFAGKKSGVWFSWDREGRQRRSVFEQPETNGAEVDRAILAALEAAQVRGDKALSEELAWASRSLKKTRPTESSSAGPSRGHDSEYESLGEPAEMSSDTADLPSQDLGGEAFAEGGTDQLSPYIRRAVRRATRKVETCYRKARAKSPRMTGEIVSRFLISSDGRADSVRIVRSDLTEGMNQCVKRVLRKIEFGKHDSGAPVEVISPWLFKVPKRR